MKKKMLFVIDSLHSGGAEKSLISLLSLFDYNEYDVDLLTFKSGGLYSDLLHEKVNRLKSPGIFNDMSYSIQDLIKKGNMSKAIWRINTSIKLRYKDKFTDINHGSQRMWPMLDKKIKPLEKQYDVAIAYSQGTPTYFVAKKVKASKKLCWINVDYKRAGYNKKFDVEYYNEFENIVTVSEACREGLIESYPEFKNKISTIYDIISEDLVNNMANKGEGFTDNFEGIRILTVGRLVYQKGYEFAIEACRLLKEDGINFKWYAIGEGNLKESLQQIIDKEDLNENFEFLGTYINPYTFIKQCDIYSQPSRFEGFGLAIAEARILNKPIVATSFQIVYDQIKNMQNGIITGMSGEELYKGIKEMIENKELRANIINNLKSEKVGTEGELEKIYKLINN